MMTESDKYSTEWERDHPDMDLKYTSKLEANSFLINSKMRDLKVIMHFRSSLCVEKYSAKRRILDCILQLECVKLASLPVFSETDVRAKSIFLMLVIREVRELSKTSRILIKSALEHDQKRYTGNRFDAMVYSYELTDGRVGETDDFVKYEFDISSLTAKDVTDCNPEILSNKLRISRSAAMESPLSDLVEIVAAIYRQIKLLNSSADNHIMVCKSLLMNEVLFNIINIDANNRDEARLRVDLLSSLLNQDAIVDECRRRMMTDLVEMDSRQWQISIGSDRELLQVPLQ